MSTIKRYEVNGSSSFYEDEEGSFVDYEDYAALEAKCAAVAAELKQSQIDASCYKKGMEASNERLVQVAAENAGLKAALNPEVIPDAAVEAFTETAIMDHDWNDTGEYSWVENDTDVIRAVLEAIKPETPATDAYRDELRAQGIEMAAKSDQFSMWVQQGLRSFAIGVRQGDERELTNLERNVLECAAVITKDRERGGAE